MNDENNIVFTEQIQIAPFRSINEFLLDKARFQLPTFNDMKKWNNRVVTNLLYYQTNYFAIALLFILASCFIHSKDLLLGTTAVGILSGVMWSVFSKNAQLVQKRAEYPYFVVAIIGLAGFYFIYVLPSVVVLLFTFAIPLVITFVHASIRLRNVSAKINMKMENLRFKQTVMGQIFDLLNIDTSQ